MILIMGNVRLVETPDITTSVDSLRTLIRDIDRRIDSSGDPSIGNRIDNLARAFGILSDSITMLRQDSGRSVPHGAKVGALIRKARAIETHLQAKGQSNAYETEIDELEKTLERFDDDYLYQAPVFVKLGLAFLASDIAINLAFDYIAPRILGYSNRFFFYSSFVWQLGMALSSVGAVVFVIGAIPEGFYTAFRWIDVIYQFFKKRDVDLDGQESPITNS